MMIADNDIQALFACVLNLVDGGNAAIHSEKHRDTQFNTHGRSPGARCRTLPSSGPGCSSPQSAPPLKEQVEHRSTVCAVDIVVAKHKHMLVVIQGFADPW